MTIAHADELGCEAKMIREWIRITCRELPETDLPERVRVVRDTGAGKSIVARRLGEQVHFVFPVRKGLDAEAVFEWRTGGWGTRTLTARFLEGESPLVAFDRGAPGVDESPISKGQIPGERPRVGRMLQVPAGARKGGKPVAAFLLDEVEVTFWAWTGCVQAGACSQPSGPSGCPRSVDGVDPFRPISCVTFDDAAKYCEWAGKRLPTPEEWWYAFQGTDGRGYPWGNDPTTTKTCDYMEHQWVEHKGKQRLLDLGCKVGSHPGGEGPFGHKDMLANVAEWTTGEKDGKKAVVGGSFGTVSGASTEEFWVALKQTMTVSYAPDARAIDVGFRCARSLGE